MTGVNTNVPCKGNGLATGFMDGHGNYAAIRANPTYGASFAQGSYGESVGAAPSGSQFSNYIVGITSDATKSGIVGTVTRSVFSVKFIIKY